MTGNTTYLGSFGLFRWPKCMQQSAVICVGETVGDRWRQLSFRSSAIIWKTSLQSLLLCFRERGTCMRRNKATTQVWKCICIKCFGRLLMLIVIFSLCSYDRQPVKVLKSLRPGPKVAALTNQAWLVRLQSDFGATAGSDGALASNFIREASGNNFRRENMRSEFYNSVQIEKLWVTFRCYSNI